MQVSGHPNEETTMLTEAYERGRRVAFDGKREDHNPYRPVNSPDYQQWLLGFRDGRQELRGGK
jgi:ribosome modulation factor